MSLYTIQSKHLPIRNGTIAYLERGPQSGTPLVLIPGFTNHFRDWHREFIDDLTSHHRLYLPNNPGIGESSTTRTEFSIETYAGDLAEWIQNLGHSKIALLGHSLGGYIAQEIARLIPDQLSALILSSSRMGGKLMTPADPRVSEVLTKRYSSPKEEKDASLSILADPEFHDQIRVHRKSVEEESAKADLAQVFVSEEVKHQQNASRINWLENFGEKQKEYQEFKFPTLILVGNNDRIIPPENGIELARAIPNSWLLRYPRGGHALSLQFPREIGRSIRTFLAIKT